MRKCPSCSCGKQIPGQDGIAKQDKINKMRKDKINKMFPVVAKLTLCPKCKSNTVVNEKTYEFCLKCDYSTLHKIKVSKKTRKYLDDLDKFETDSCKSLTKDKRRVK